MNALPVCTEPMNAAFYGVLKKRQSIRGVIQFRK